MRRFVGGLVLVRVHVVQGPSWGRGAIVQLMWIHHGRMAVIIPVGICPS